MKTINWSQIVWDLQRTGWDAKRIAQHLRVSRTSILSLRDGTRQQPRFQTGCRLLTLWQRETNQALSMHYQRIVQCAPVEFKGINDVTIAATVTTG